MWMTSFIHHNNKICRWLPLNQKKVTSKKHFTDIPCTKQLFYLGNKFYKGPISVQLFFHGNKTVVAIEMCPLLRQQPPIEHCHSRHSTWFRRFFIETLAVFMETLKKKIFTEYMKLVSWSQMHGVLTPR